MLATRTFSWLLASLVMATGPQVAAASMETKGVTAAVPEKRFLAQKQPEADQQALPPSHADDLPQVVTTTTAKTTSTRPTKTTTTRTSTTRTKTSTTRTTTTRTRTAKRTTTRPTKTTTTRTSTTRTKTSTTRTTTTRTRTTRTKSSRPINVETTFAELETTTQVETGTAEAQTTTEVETELETTTTEVATTTAAAEPLTTQAAPATTIPASPTVAPAEACLCVFDIDRTLTSKQGTTGRCPGAEQVDGIWDYAFGGGNFTLSELGSLGIGATFCDGCLLGVVSAGKAQDEGDYLLNHLLHSSAYDELLASSSIGGFDWSSSQTEVLSPFVLRRGGFRKPGAVKAIVGFYESFFPGLSIPNNRVHFFDDRAENVVFFVGTGYNAREVSCASRDFSIYNRTGRVGRCGALVEEIVADEGVVKC